MHYKEVKAILSPQNGLNIYRGCSYSCVFCDARSTCHRMDHEFEDIEVKAHAVDMLEYALKKKRTRSMIQIGSSSEPYIPLEEELQLVRRCLNQIERFDFGLVLHTHSMLALRDIDILDKINRKTKCIVIVRLYKNVPDIYDQYEAVYADEKTLKTKNYTEIMACIRETCEAHGIQYDKEELLRFTREYKNKTIGTQLSLFDMM